MEAGNVYFYLKPDCLLITGAVNAAIYNLSSGDVYAVDHEGRKVLELTESGRSISSACFPLDEVSDETKVVKYLNELEGMQLGDFSQSPVPPEKMGIPAVSFSLRKVWLELTESCNLKCVHCYANASLLPPNSSLSPKRWETLISEAAGLGASWIQFIGGEPLLVGKEKMFRLISRAREADYRFIEVFTNGTLLDDEYVDFFAGTGVHVALSLYSKRPDIHDSVTQVPGSFQRLMEGLERLRRRGVPFRVSLVVMKQNRQYEQETLEWIRENFEGSPFNCDVVRCTPGGRDRMIELLTPDLWIRRVRGDSFFPKTPFNAFVRNRSGHPCWSDGICVNQEGKVFTCIMERTQVLGDVNQASLMEIISGKEVQGLWGLSKDNLKICRECEFRYACFDCRPMVMAISEALGKQPTDPYAKDPCCLYDPYSGEWGSIVEFMDLLFERGMIARTTNP